MAARLLFALLVASCARTVVSFAEEVGGECHAKQGDAVYEALCTQQTTEAACATFGATCGWVVGSATDGGQIIPPRPLPSQSIPRPAVGWSFASRLGPAAHLPAPLARSQPVRRRATPRSLWHSLR